MIKLYKPNELLKYFSSFNITPKKKLSQNFLVDKNVIDKLLNAAEIDSEDIILEIGPGAGTITRELLKNSKKVIAIEKDDLFAKNLKNLKEKNLEVKNLDFLKFDLSYLSHFEKKFKVVSAIPYHITTPIIKKLLKNFSLFSCITLIVQKELAQRLKSEMSTKRYNFFSIFVNFYAYVEIVSYVSKNCFLPKPKVDSAIIKLTPKNQLQNISEDKFFKFVQTAFLQKRKKLVTSLNSFCDKEQLRLMLQDLNIDQNARAENLSVNNFLTLFEKLF